LTKKDIKIAIFSAFAGIVFTAIYDLIKSKPILSTFWNGLKWIWINIFEFEVTIWQIMLGILTLFFILYLLSKRESKIPENQFDWRDYTKDKIHNMTWSWFWEENFLNQKWNIKDLRPICDSCGTKDNYRSNKFADCPRCGKIYKERKDLEKIEAIIIDNVQRGIFPKEFIE